MRAKCYIANFAHKICTFSNFCPPPPIRKMDRRPCPSVATLPRKDCAPPPPNILALSATVPPHFGKRSAGPALGYFEDLSPFGGGGLFWPPPQISATNGPIDLKIGSRKTSQVE